MDVGNQLIGEFVRKAGEVTLPPEGEALKNLLLKGMLQDETGRITITPRGEVEIQRADSPLIFRGSAGVDPSVYVGYQSRKPSMVGRAPEDALDEALRSLEQAY